ncbi:MAG: helix-turn-helix transcriptional regulator [Lachnospiraceae bacterium]|nr:helix-turn-helix transcriptional regulator [Lachnospiraceae bacterium]
MKIGEKIKELRKQKGLSVEEVADKLGVSVSTQYRYENASITKIPIDVIDKLCKILDTTTGELMGTNSVTTGDAPEIPMKFDSASDAMTSILKMPMLAAYGGYDLESMDDETLKDFANEILGQLRLVSYKYKDNNEKK